MVDNLTSAQRRYCMGRVKSSNTKPEVRLRKALWEQGVRYRLKAELPGKPDVVFKGPRVAVFVDGCFWHRCPIHKTTPQKNRDFWERKFQRNVARDNDVNGKLAELGWRVLRFWEHELKSNMDAVVTAIIEAVRSER